MVFNSTAGGKFFFFSDASSNGFAPSLKFGILGAMLKKCDRTEYPNSRWHCRKMSTKDEDNLEYKRKDKIKVTVYTKMNGKWEILLLWKLIVKV